jgi:hypothetical protein
LNPQPLVLETSALPIELLAYMAGTRTKHVPAPTKLLRFAMRSVFLATRTILVELKTVRVITTVLLSRVIAFLAVVTLKCDDRSNVFLFGCHTNLPAFSAYSMILVTTPAPTVRPPSRMANFEPCSNATGTISSTVRFTLSPGITISTPSGSVMSPVTSIVRM